MPRAAEIFFSLVGIWVLFYIMFKLLGRLIWKWKHRHDR